VDADGAASVSVTHPHGTAGGFSVPIKVVHRGSETPPSGARFLSNYRFDGRRCGVRTSVAGLPAPEDGTPPRRTRRWPNPTWLVSHPERFAFGDRRV